MDDRRDRTPLSGHAARLGTALVAMTCSLAWSLPAAGEAAPDRLRSGAYYAIHGGAILGLAGTSLLLRGALPTVPGADPQWFPGDTSVRGHWAPSAIALSNVTVVLTLTAPVVAEAVQGFNYRLLNAGVVYGETISASVALNSVVKVLFARPRPYTYGPGALDPSIDDPPERYVSFYSGHSSTAFASAVAGSYLFAEGATNEASRVAFWATELTLAAATANLRVIAGKHYYSDVVVGSLIGIGFGIGVPLLHGASYVPRPLEYVAAGSGVGLGILITELLPLKNLAQRETVASVVRALNVSVAPQGRTLVSLQGGF